jgi:hypothetical protein
MPVWAVPSYRCYYLDSNDHVVGFDLIGCASDSLARDRADILLANSALPGIEVWDRDRVVYRARKTGDSIVRSGT